MNGITSVPGVRVGHWTDLEGITGCTVILTEAGAACGVDVRGSAPGTRETDLLRPGSLVTQVHGIVLTGGSAFGLAAADGVMRYLDERGFGFETKVAKVPIVPAAVLFDLGIGSVAARPTAESGYHACLAATDGPIAEGSVGAGTGATVAKRKGIKRAVKGGLATVAGRAEGGARVGVIVAVNAIGAICRPDGSILAGERPEGEDEEQPVTNTTIAVVATDAKLDTVGCQKVAQMAQDGLARAIRPAHLLGDGDTVFAIATGTRRGKGNPSRIGAAAADLLALAIVRAVELAESLGGVPSVRELRAGG